MSMTTEREDVAAAPGLCIVGCIETLKVIPNADRLYHAQVTCGSFGTWWGLVSKTDFTVGDLCNVYLQDAVVPETDAFAFMAKYRYRVRIQRLRGVVSEVLITPLMFGDTVGQDVTTDAGVLKYEKPVPAQLRGLVKGNFPTFIPKTDEPNFQRCENMLNALQYQQVYIAEKADGSSMTAYRWSGVFGVCSRNLDLVETDGNAYWQVARGYYLPDLLPEGYAIQGELVGPGIQSNPLGLSTIDLRVFQIYNISEQRYLDFPDFLDLCNRLRLPSVRIIGSFVMPSVETLRDIASRTVYPTGKPAEGIVVRPVKEMRLGRDRVSFKVINPDYQE